MFDTNRSSATTSLGVINLLRPARLALIALSLFSLAQQDSPHEREFWQAIVKADYAVPDGEDAYRLLQELNGLLDSPDPELRDTFGYAIPAAWIYRQKRFTDDQLREQVLVLCAKLKQGLGKSGDASVLGRSFAALNLSVLVARDLQKPFLSDADFAQLAHAAQDYLEAERDLRGHEPGLGWLHSCAHTADLIRFIGRHEKLVAGPVRAGLYQAIGSKFAAPSGYVFIHGEDDRMAQAMLSLLRREDFELAEFELFCTALHAVRDLDAETKPEFSPIRNAALRNAKNLLRALLQALRGGAIADAVLAEALEERILGTIAQLE